jgi:UDP-glucose:tetrahydrobiopterin glucosyltransferase
MSVFNLNSWRILLVSTPVAPLGTGFGGGVELSLKNLAQSLQLNGHQVTVLAPEGSVLPNMDLQAISGKLQVSMQFLDRDEAMCLPDNSVLANLWERARELQKDYDLILNFAYDWLPFYLTPFFQTPVAHLVSMCSLTHTMDGIIRTQVQAETFGLSHLRCIGNALDLDLYKYCPEPQDYLAWVGRVSPEKAIEDAIAVSEITGLELRVYGILQDFEYWEALKQKFPNASINYRGFLCTQALQLELRQSKAMLMTPRWVEAFGNVTIEALACGVPVIAYRRGGPAEIIRDGVTGYLVEPEDSVQGLVRALDRIHKIDRLACRRHAETEYSLSAYGDRLHLWFQSLIQDKAIASHLFYPVTSRI